MYRCGSCRFRRMLLRMLSRGTIGPLWNIWRWVGSRIWLSSNDGLRSMLVVGPQYHVRVFSEGRGYHEHLFLYYREPDIIRYITPNREIRVDSHGVLAPPANTDSLQLIARHSLLRALRRLRVWKWGEKSAGGDWAPWARKSVTVHYRGMIDMVFDHHRRPLVAWNQELLQIISWGFDGDMLIHLMNLMKNHFASGYSQ